MVRAKLRKKYSGPSHLWQMDRIQEEKQIRRSYGCKNKAEIWKVQSKLRKFRAQARRLIPLTGRQAQLEKKQLLTRLFKLGLVKENAKIEDVLALKITDLMERRLQTLVLNKKLANTVKQARQMISHGHIQIGSKKVKSPTHLVTLGQEPEISFAGNSPFISEMHPERVAGNEKREKKNRGQIVEDKALELKKESKRTEKTAEPKKPAEKKSDSKKDAEAPAEVEA